MSGDTEHYDAADYAAAQPLLIMRVALLSQKMFERVGEMPAIATGAGAQPAEDAMPPPPAARRRAAQPPHRQAAPRRRDSAEKSATCAQ